MEMEMLSEVREKPPRFPMHSHDLCDWRCCMLLVQTGIRLAQVRTAACGRISSHSQGHSLPLSAVVVVGGRATGVAAWRESRESARSGAGK